MRNKPNETKNKKNKNRNKIVKFIDSECHKYSEILKAKSTSKMSLFIQLFIHSFIHFALMADLSFN